MTSFVIEPQKPGDAAFIEAMLDASFGIGRRVKTSYRLREREEAAEGLSFVARDPSGLLVGAISFWHLRIGPDRAAALLLGPLAVHPDHQAQGIGLALMKQGLAVAKGQGHGLIILVGDAPYYARVGFQPVPEGQMLMPGPVDLRRLLALELKPGMLAGAHGLILPPHRVA
jgi:predicted N-acetyltransferase YhbS